MENNLNFDDVKLIFLYQPQNETEKNETIGEEKQKEREWKYPKHNDDKLAVITAGLHCTTPLKRPSL